MINKVFQVVERYLSENLRRFRKSWGHAKLRGDAIALSCNTTFRLEEDQILNHSLLGTTNGPRWPIPFLYLREDAPLERKEQMRGQWTSKKHEKEKWKIESRSQAGEIFENSSRANFRVVAYAAWYNLIARVSLIGKETLHARKAAIETTTPLVRLARTHALTENQILQNYHEDCVGDAPLLHESRENIL